MWKCGHWFNARIRAHSGWPLTWTSRMCKWTSVRHV